MPIFEIIYRSSPFKTDVVSGLLLLLVSDTIRIPLLIDLIASYRANNVGLDGEKLSEYIRRIDVLSRLFDDDAFAHIIECHGM